MAEEKESTSIPLSQAVDPEDPAKAPPISPSSSTRKGSNLDREKSWLDKSSLVGLDTHSIATPPSQACGAVLQSWVSKKFMTGCVVLFPVAVTFYITWWFIQFVDGLLLTLFYILDVSGRMSVGSRFILDMVMRLHTVLAVDVYSDKIKHLFDATEGQEAARRPWGGWIYVICAVLHFFTVALLLNIFSLVTINLVAIYTLADYHTRPLDTICSNFIDALPVNKKERKKVREVSILKKDPEAIREQIEKMERMRASDLHCLLKPPDLVQPPPPELTPEFRSHLFHSTASPNREERHLPELLSDWKSCPPTSHLLLLSLPLPRQISSSLISLAIASGSTWI
ncbi:hypothetical protein ZIOFF_043459 [Zingiber officinale]|uniref:Wbp11/ELF5/Saf1 N-terminal domain-containing protein n=1 Tax=Zingiber officinale TaxID=94328 RepID=A0A8J5FUZ8_ZINOF|nr:hypothetical protein ZIOFF_043459 [Zingiber officinale]